MGDDFKNKIEYVLLQEIKNRFPLNTKLKCILSNQEFTLSDYEIEFYTQNGNEYLFHLTSNYFLYKNGVWSTPIIDLISLDKQVDELLENETEESLSKHFKLNNWIQTNNRTVSFHYNDEPYLIHIIKTGFENKYMVVWEDAYELDLGKVEFFTKEEILEKFKIDIENRLKIINS